jgi:hypothetical protein
LKVNDDVNNDVVDYVDVSDDAGNYVNVSNDASDE